MEDISEITAMATQGISTSVQGSIQSLVVFGEDAITVITGDAANGNLATNTLDTSTGTAAGRSVVSTPKGTMFMAADGMRFISNSGALEDPNLDLKNPFIFALTPSRASACYNNNIYRITVQNGHVNGNPLQEWWFDFRNSGWTGPHTFTQSMCVAYGKTFIAFVNTITPALFTSDVVQSGTSTFTENGSPLAFLERTAPLQDDGGMYEGSAVLSVVDMQIPQVAQSYTIVASDVNNGVLATATIAFSSTGAVWNGFTWGVGVWTATSYGLERYNIPWTSPLVFSRLVWQITGTSILNLRIGKLTIGEQPTKYVRAL